jgi:hypothetical protein
VHSSFKLHALKALGALLFSAAFILAGCHNNNQDAGFGIAWTTLSVDPDPRFTSYLVVVDSVVMTGKADGAVTAIATPELIDLAKLNNVSELWASASLPIDTYTAATITLDYTAAQISVLVNGVPTAVQVLDSTGAPVTQVVVAVQLDPANQITPVDTLSATDARRLALNLDLAATNSINFATTPPTLTVNPYMSVSTAASDNRLIRVRGPLINSSVPEGTYTITTRPFFDEVDSLGILTLFNSPTTVYSIAGSTVVGAPGLSAISVSSAGSTMTAAYTTFQPTTVPQPGVIAGKFNTQYVISGGTLEDFFTDGLEGDVIARSGNTLTLRSAVLAQTSAQAVNLIIPDTPVTLGPGTLVTADGIPGLTLNQSAVTVGQHVVVRGLITSFDPTTGALTFDASGTTNTDTGSVRIVSLDTRVSGSILSTDNASTATLNLDSINGYPVSVFNFAGTGSASGTNANPASFVVSSQGLGFPANPAGNALAAGDYLAVNGYGAPFGSAPPDFLASTINAEATIPATINVQWTTGDSAPFATATSASLSVNLTNAALTTASILIAGETIDMTTLPVSPQISPVAATTDPNSALTLFMPVFSVGSNALGIESFNTLTPFEAQAATLFATTPATQFLAHGFYNRATNVFTASRINVVL